MRDLMISSPRVAVLWFLLAAVPLFASDAMLVFSDRLNHGWGHWGWQVLPFVHGLLDASNYTYFPCWINDSAAGGRLRCDHEH